MMTSLMGELEDRDELVSATFALMTASLEEAAVMAAKDQNRKEPRAEIMYLASRIISFNDEVSIFLRLAVAIAPPS